MDEFAQSREDDDLFADEFEPVAEPVVTVETSALSDEQHISDQPAVTANESTTNASSNASSHIPGGQPQSYGRREQPERKPRNGRGRGGGGATSVNVSRWARPDDNFGSVGGLEPQESKPPTAPTTKSTSPPPTTTTATANVPPPPTEPSNATPQPQRVPAVRGDRSATGGPTHKKLTEEELTAKLAQMAIINAQKAERHRLTVEDQAAFQHREKELAKERREKEVQERKNERVMEMEREKNRVRKLKAQQGREWDMEKMEESGNGRSSQFVRGDFGGVIKGRGVGLASSKYSAEEDTITADSGGARGRGGGGFEIRGRGGRSGRGGRGGKASTQTRKEEVIPTPEDFPALPVIAPVTAAKKPSQTTEQEPKTVNDSVKSPAAEKPAEDWAEEMATPV